MMKMAGGAHLDEIDTDAFLEQAAEYENTGDLRDGVLKLLNTEKQTHPFAVVRAAELRAWASTDEYAAILRGDYPRREDDQTASFSDSAKEAARSYKKRIDESTDPLVGAVRNVGSTIGNAADSFVDWIARKTSRPTNDAPGDPNDPEGPDGTDSTDSTGSPSS